MSYTIEYKSEVYKIPAEWKGSSENDYVMVVTQGDNNVYESSNNRRARSKYILGQGWAYSIIGKVCHRAGACEGGSLVINGRSITPEGYIKKYRDLIKNAPLILTFFEQHNTARFEISYDKDSEYDKERMEKYKEYITEEADRWTEGKTNLYATITIKDKESWDIFTDLKGLSRYGDIFLGDE